jgi:small subunit ribosomal protein S20
MANHKSAKKRTRRNASRMEVNKSRKSRMRTFVKKVELAIEAKDAKLAQEALRLMQPELSRSVSKGLIHKNAAARKLSRLTAKVKALASWVLRVRRFYAACLSLWFSKFFLNSLSSGKEFFAAQKICAEKNFFFLCSFFVRIAWRQKFSVGWINHRDMSKWPQETFQESLPYSGLNLSVPCANIFAQWSEIISIADVDNFGGM